MCDISLKTSWKKANEVQAGIMNGTTVCGSIVSRVIFYLLCKTSLSLVSMRLGEGKETGLGTKLENQPAL